MVSHANRRRIGAAVAACWIGLPVFSPPAVAGQPPPTATSSSGEPAAAPANAAGSVQPPTATASSVRDGAASTGAQAAATEEEAQLETPAAVETTDAVEQSAGRPAADPAVESAGGTDDAPMRGPITRRDVFRLGGPVTIGRGERVRGDATVILGPLTLDGEVTGDVTVIAGPLRIGPQAEVRGDLTVVGGTLQEAPTAALRGSVTHIGFADLGLFRVFGPSAGFDGWGFIPRPFVGWREGGHNLPGMAMRLLILALLASGIVLVARTPVERIAQRARAEPVKAGVVGVLAQMLAIPVFVTGILMAVISIVGIPLLLLLPFVVMAAGLVMLVGFSGAVLGAGELVRNRMGVSSTTAYASVWAGVALILLPTLAGEALGVAGGLFRGLGVLLALLGLLLEYAAWTTGLGAFILSRVSSPPSPAGRLDRGISET